MDLLAARMQMALTLGFHIILACYGVGLPVLLLFAEARYLRTGDEGWKTLARRWAKAFAVLFAVGAVSGTVLSFELGFLWPEFMGTYGSVIGLPFTLEAFAFFLEAIFVGIYLYGWNRLSKTVHCLTLIPVALSGAASAWFVVTANAWMNAPQGFRMEGGRVVDVDPWAAMLNPATGAQTTHMLIAAYMVTGFSVAAYYAFHILRGRDDLYHRRALAVGLAMGIVCAPAQVVAGHWSGSVVGRTQPAKLAAMEGQFKTEARAPLRLGGFPDEARGETRWAIEIPGGLSWMTYGDPDHVVVGLNDIPPKDRPPVPIVHFAFQAMVGVGTALAGLAIGTFGWLLLKRRLPPWRIYLWALVGAGPLSVLALEAGWTVTEVGRQPWIVQGHMRTSQAVTGATGLGLSLALAIGIYFVLIVGTIVILRRLAKVPHGT